MRTFREMALREVEFEQDDGPVGDGGSGAHYVTASDGSKWVAKAPYLGSQPHRYLYLNETLSKLIAERLGVPVPGCAALNLTQAQADALRPDRSGNDRLIFACERIERPEAFSPEVARAVSEEERAGIAVLDALVWNTDNKPEHVLAEQDNGGWRVWPVDHGHTFAVADSLQSLPQQDAPYPPFPLLNEGVTRTHLGAWIDRAKGIEQEEFTAMVRTLPPDWIIEPNAPEELAEALYKRRQNLDQVLYQVFQ
jgi:hypothetical protein